MMRGILDRYVRSLREREPDRYAPERTQDLGTFVDWLLHREGADVVRRPFYDREVDGARTKKSGVVEHGIDLVAVRPDEQRFYRFVLKQGDVTQDSWERQGRGSLFDDLKKAAALPAQRDRRHAPNLTFERVTIVAVHNGDRADEVRDLIEGEMAILKAYAHVEDVEWWHADELVRRALVVGPDSDLLPPETRPFVRLVVDSLAKEPGGRLFDYRALDLAIDTILPLDRNMKQRDAERQAAELALVVSLIHSAAERQNVRLPVLDAIERVLCRIMASLGSAGKPARKKHILPVLRGLRDGYVEVAHRLKVAISSFATDDYGLAVTPVGDVVGYPLRALRLCGYLATAGLMELERKQRKRADEFASFLHDVVEHNPGGCLSPVCDDQMIELGLVWQLWLRTGRKHLAADVAAKVVERLAVRCALGFPRPALWHRASVPPEETSLRALLKGHLQSSASGHFEDGASTLLPLALYVAQRGGAACDPDWLKAFLAESGRSPLYAELWVPPNNGAELWYRGPLLDVGVCHVIDLNAGFDGAIHQFEALASPVQKSRAARFGLSSLDWVAFKRWRTLPPMEVFVRHFS